MGIMLLPCASSIVIARTKRFTERKHSAHCALPHKCKALSSSWSLITCIPFPVDLEKLSSDPRAYVTTLVESPEQSRPCPKATVSLPPPVLLSPCGAGRLSSSLLTSSRSLRTSSKVLVPGTSLAASWALANSWRQCRWAALRAVCRLRMECVCRTRNSLAPRRATASAEK